MTSAQTQGWEPLWATSGSLSNYWRVPEPSVVAWAEGLWQAGGRRVLDLGCGIGRHTVAFARMGLSVTATDVSASGLTICTAWLDREGLSASRVRHQMGFIPFPNCTFDGLVAYNVIYHTTAAGMNQVLAEVSRVIRPKGRLYATIIARRDSRVASYQTGVAMGKCVEIEPFTFIYPRDAPGDKYLPHHYSDETEVRGFVAGFVVDDLRLVRVEYADEDGVVQTGAHYHIQARRS